MAPSANKAAELAANTTVSVNLFMLVIGFLQSVGDTRRFSIVAYPDTFGEADTRVVP